MKTIITRVTPNDINQLQEIGKQTFAETFASSNSDENMKTYLDEKFSEQRLLTELSNPYSSFFFAWVDKQVAGYLKINWSEAQTEIKDNQGLEIERIYVLQNYQRQNIGQLLYKKAIEEATLLNLDYVWLGVWEENMKAVAFYKKNGFIEFDKHIFKLGDDEQTDIMMRHYLKK